MHQLTICWKKLIRLRRLRSRREAPRILQLWHDGLHCCFCWPVSLVSPDSSPVLSCPACLSCFIRPDAIISSLPPQCIIVSTENQFSTHWMKLHHHPPPTTNASSSNDDSDFCVIRRPPPHIMIKSEITILSSSSSSSMLLSNCWIQSLDTNRLERAGRKTVIRLSLLVHHHHSAPFQLL